MYVLVQWYRHFYSWIRIDNTQTSANTFSCYDCGCVRIVCVFQTSFVDDWFGRLTFALIECRIRWGDFFLSIYLELSFYLPTKMNFKYWINSIGRPLFQIGIHFIQKKRDFDTLIQYLQSVERNGTPSVVRGIETIWTNEWNQQKVVSEIELDSNLNDEESVNCNFYEGNSVWLIFNLFIFWMWRMNWSENSKSVQQIAN